MGRELYMRDPQDPYYKAGVLEVSDEMEMLISQIKMMLFTNKGEILGAPDFGANLEEQLFSLNANQFTLKSMLMDQTMKFIPMSERYQVTYDVKFARGTVRDICVIDVRVLNEPVFGVVVT